MLEGTDDDPSKNDIQQSAVDPESTSDSGGLIGNTTDSNNNNGLGAVDTAKQENQVNPSDFYEKDLKDAVKEFTKEMAINMLEEVGKLKNVGNVVSALVAKAKGSSLYFSLLMTPRVKSKDLTPFPFDKPTLRARTAFL